MALLVNIMLLGATLLNGLFTGFNTLNIVYAVLAVLLLALNLEPVIRVIKLDKSILKPAYRLATYVVAFGLAYAIFHVMPQSQELKDYDKANDAYVMIQSGKTDEAIRQLDSLKESLKDNSVYHQNFAVAYMNKGLLDLARKELDQAYSLNPSNYSIFYNYGLWYYKSKDYKSAQQHFTAAAEMNPGMVSAYKYAGKAYRLQNNMRAAIYQFNLAKRFAPENLELSYLVGKAYYDLNEFDNAKTELLKVQQTNPPAEIKSDVDKMLTNLEKIGQEVKAQ